MLGLIPASAPSEFTFLGQTSFARATLLPRQWDLASAQSVMPPCLGFPCPSSTTQGWLCEAGCLPGSRAAGSWLLLGVILKRTKGSEHK